MTWVDNDDSVAFLWRRDLPDLLEAGESALGTAALEVMLWGPRPGARSGGRAAAVAVRLGSALDDRGVPTASEDAR